MRKSGGLLIPLSLITAYYVFWVAVTMYLLSRFPALHQYMPIGGIEYLAGSRSTRASGKPCSQSTDRSDWRSPASGRSC